MHRGGGKKTGLLTTSLHKKWFENGRGGRGVYAPTVVKKKEKNEPRAEIEKNNRGGKEEEIASPRSSW